MSYTESLWIRVKEKTSKSDTEVSVHYKLPVNITLLSSHPDRVLSLSGGLMTAYSFLTFGAEGQCWSLLSGDSGRTWGNSRELYQGRVWFSIWKRFFLKKVNRYWNRLPRDAVMTPSMPEFKKHLDNAFRNTVFIFGWSCVEWGAELDYSCGFPPIAIHSMII